MTLGESKPQSEDKQKHLDELKKNLSVESLKILAEKSRKPGIEQKLRQFKNFI